MHNYRIIPEEGLIVQILRGDITIDAILESTALLVRDSLFDPRYNCVVDFRQGIILMSLKELKDAADRYSESDSFKGRKALLVNRSVDTAKIMIFRSHVGPGERFSVYSTVEGASSFLQNDLSRYLDEDIIREDLYRDPQSERTRSSDPPLYPNNLS
ncbi:MAG: hypothetical protein JXR86_05760 [Spirochaetales bacterium]|nr:hypothetical protein [Spirochaetales bacterium]